MRYFSICVLALVFLSFTGCAGVFNPYDSEFQCPNTYKGKCVSVQDAYHDSVTGAEPPDTASSIKESEPECKTGQLAKDQTAQKGTENPEYDFLKQKYDKLSALIGNPAVPVVVPPEVVRVLILSYTGADNELFGYRYVYFFATGPEWVLSTAREDID